MNARIRLADPVFHDGVEYTELRFKNPRQRDFQRRDPLPAFFEENVDPVTKRTLSIAARLARVDLPVLLALSERDLSEVDRVLGQLCAKGAQ